MRPKLKEQPIEWLKFTLAMSVVFGVLAALWWRKHLIPTSGFRAILMALGCADVLCWLRPAWYRPFYRAGMTVGFYIGQVMGRILLALFFILVLTPLGLGLRWAGKDLLRLRKGSRSESYWRPARAPGPLDRQF